MKTQSYRLEGYAICKDTADERFVTRADAVAAAREILCGEPLSRVKIIPTEDHPTCTAHEFAGEPEMVAITTLHIPEKQSILATGIIEGSRRHAIILFDEWHDNQYTQGHISAGDEWIRKHLPGAMVGPMADDGNGGFIRLAYDPRFNTAPVSFRPVR